MGPSLDRMSALGASLLPSGVTFRVWAPRCQAVDVVVDGRAVEALVPREGGLFEARLEGAAEGARYKSRLDGARYRPDPASRFQPEGIHGPSVVVDPNRFVWTDQEFAGPAPGDLVFYETHVGAFTAAGTFEAIILHLPRLVDLGITALELMPVAEFPGSRNWGYDGVHLFAPQSTYGGPRGLRRLVDACHARGLSVFLDVVYNHLGPEGNYLAEYGPYFTDRYSTPWGPAVNFDGAGCEGVRRHVTENGRMWVSEFYVDFGRDHDLERVITQGFAFQGEPSEYWGRPRGTPSADLPGDRFVIFLQNHDQVGNRAQGERLGALLPFEAVKLAAGLLFVSPAIPLLFMGEEYGETSRFQFFTSFLDRNLAESVRRGRAEEFARFAWRGPIADPNAPNTFVSSRLNHPLASAPRHRGLREYYRHWLMLRRTHSALGVGGKELTRVTQDASGALLTVIRAAASGDEVKLVANLTAKSQVLTLEAPAWRVLLDSDTESFGGTGAAAPLAPYQCLLYEARR